MKTIALISQKGGAGKTTLTLNLAVTAQHNGKSVLVVDVDPQSSSAQWGDQRKDDEPVVISAQVSRLDSILETARENNVDLVIIDTAPHSDSSALACARHADLVLIPCRPSVLDLRAVAQTADIATLAKKRAVVVLNAVPPVGNLSKDVAEILADGDVEVAPVHVAQRADFLHSLTQNKTAQEYEPDGKATQEIQALYRWMQTCLQDY